MARIAPQQRLRWRQAVPGRVEVTWGAARRCLRFAGDAGGFGTLPDALPRQPIARSLVATLRGLGVETDHILWREQDGWAVLCGNGRRSTEFHGPLRRDYSAIYLAAPRIRLDAALSGVIGCTSPASRPPSARMPFDPMSTWSSEPNGRRVGLVRPEFSQETLELAPGVSSRQLARECMSQVLGHVDLVIGNEEDAADVLDIHAESTNVAQGRSTRRL